MKVKQAIKIVKKPFIATDKRVNSFLKRRPHRSFRRTDRRDYKRSLKLPGYWAFTNHVKQTLWKNRKIFLLSALLYAVSTVLIVGFASQDIYSTLRNTINATGGDIFNGVLGEFGKAGILFVSAATGGLTQTLTESQQIYAGLIVLLAWLTNVWLLRNIMAGHRVKLRDGLYNAGAPILPTFMVGLLLIVQLLPAALAFIGYAAASATGLLDGGVEAMLFWVAAGLLIMLSLYFVTTTIFALIIVTLPGMYPYKAIKTAGDMVVGRRMRLLLRLIWLIVGIVVVWAIIMIPLIMFDGWIKSVWPVITWLPLIPLALMVLGSLTVIWTSSYIYLLYRKVIADESAPA